MGRMRTHAERISYPLRILLVPVLHNTYVKINMWYKIFALLPIVCCISAAPQSKELQTAHIEDFPSGFTNEKDDLKTAASSYSHQYSDWGGSSPGGYGYSVTGFGVINNKYDSNTGRISGYDNTYPTAGYPGYSGGTGYVGAARPLSSTGYVGNSEYGGYKGYGGYSPNVYGSMGGYGGYEGNGGYGGYGGNGGLSSYSGYNNPYYQGSNHLGYGYYQRPGNIYKGGSVTPSFANGYRGYTRR